MGKMFIVTSGKGGTGKTTVAVNLAAALAEKKESVLIVDMNIGFRNTDLYIGKENDVVYDSSDVINGVCGVEQAVVKDERFDSLYLLAAAPEHQDGVNIRKMSALIGSLKGDYDYIVVDMPTGVAKMIACLAEYADKVILVSTADYASIRNTDALDRKLLALGTDRQTVVINRLIPEFMNEGVVPKLREIAYMVRPEILGVIQEDRVIQVASNLGVPIMMKKDTYIRGNFKEIAEALKTC